MFFCWPIDLFFCICIRADGDKAKALKSCNNCGAENSRECGNCSCFDHANHCEKADGTNYAAYYLESENKILECFGINTFGKGRNKVCDGLLSCS